MISPVAIAGRASGFLPGQTLVRLLFVFLAFHDALASNSAADVSRPGGGGSLVSLPAPTKAW